MNREDGGGSPQAEACDELAREVKRLIEENRRFLERIMDDGFEEEAAGEEREPVEEI